MKKLTAFFCLLGLSLSLNAQSGLFVDTTITPEQMVMDFFNTNQVAVSNVQFTGASGAVAFFEAANTDLDLLAGLMLSSGQCAQAAYPVSYFANADNLISGGDSDLSALFPFGAFIRDAAALEFDLVSQVDTLCFIYRFGSEEYPEYACSPFNDVFAFFVEGPGYSSKTNIAIIPGDTLPVSINNIHLENPIYAPCPPTHPEFYVDYASQNGQHVAYDGLTTTLPAKFAVQAGETYHIKIAISDVSDGIFDSGVFLSINSLGGDSLLNPVAEMAAPVMDGTTVTFVNKSRYGTAWHWDFGDGTTSNERYPAPHVYPQFGPNGEESSPNFEVTLITTNYCCSDTAKTTVSLGSSSVDDLRTNLFKLSPNPASEWLTVEPFSAENYMLRIFDASGRVVFQQTANGTKNVGLQELNAGIYTCEVIQGKAVSRQRFAKR